MKESEEGPFLVALIAIDETRYWSLDQIENGHKVDKVMGVYLFDREQKTYCCELTPSYWLEPLRSVAVLKDEFEHDEKLVCDIEDHAHCSPGAYYHVGVVDRMLRDNPESAYVDPHEYESFDDAVEQHQCNHELY